jgi:O-antigen ligase
LAQAKRTGVFWASALIFAGASLSLLNATSITDAAGPFSRLLTLFGLFALLAIAHSQDIRRHYVYLLVGISVNCFITLLQAFVYTGTVAALSINPARDDLSSSGRYQGLTTHPNVLGLSAALGVLIGVALLSFSSGHRWRKRLMAAIVVCFIAALLSGSRTFFAGLIPGLMVFAYLRGFSFRTVARVTVLLGVGYFVLSYVTPALLSEYFGRIESSGSDYAADYGRWITAGLAVVQIAAKPIVGWGVDHFGEAGLLWIPGTPEIAAAHVTILQYWYAAGVLGAIGFLCSFALPARQIYRALKVRCTQDSRELLHLSMACTAFLFVTSNLHPILYNRFLFVPVFIFAGFATRVLDKANVSQTMAAKSAA